MTRVHDSGFCLQGGRVLSPDVGIVVADVHVRDGCIVDAPDADARRVDCSGLIILPGIIDVHGDAFEREIHPRPGVNIDADIAMASVDRQLIANGITTAFHGLTLSWEPGQRSRAQGRAFMAALEAVRPQLVAEHRVQLRWETFAHDAMADVTQWLGAAPTPALAFNDHTTATLEKVAAGNHKKLDQWAARAGLTPAAYLEAVEEAAAAAPHVPDAIAHMVEAAHATGAVMLSHDEKTVDARAASRALGIDVCEFPLERAVAAYAIAAGEHVILGGPNVIRGGSHTGALTAEDAIVAGECTVLASDYYYPSLLRAAERLVRRDVLPLARAWALVSANPAAAMRLDDRGEIAVGKRADLVVLDAAGGAETPWRVVHTLAAGRLSSFA